jgi:rubrerythrin
MTEHLHGKFPSSHGVILGLERHYRCESCGEAHTSWRRIRTCPTCGAALMAALIRRVALSGGTG